MASKSHDAVPVADQVIELNPADIDVSGRIGLFFPEKAEAYSVLIARDGQHTPIFVRRNGNRAKQPWKLVAGLHRHRGCEIAGLNVRALAVEGDDDAMTAMQASENLDRREPSPLERAMFVAAVADAAQARLRRLHHGKSQQQIAAEIGASERRGNLPQRSNDRVDKVQFTPVEKADAEAESAADALAQAGLQEAFKKPLVAFFDRLGRGAVEASTELLEAELGKARGAKSDDLIVETILDRLGIPKWASELRAIYEAQYLEIAKATGDAADAAGLGASLPDQVAQSIVAAGGRRAGLVDLDRQTRAALFEALAEGRAAGEGAVQLAARILPTIAAGPSLDPVTRSLRIARTEAKYAQNISTIERGRAAGVASFIVFDGRLGPGRSLLSHIARDGSIVGIQQAAVMADAEHPNGTLSFAPNFEED